MAAFFMFQNAYNFCESKSVRQSEMRSKALKKPYAETADLKMVGSYVCQF